MKKHNDAKFVSKESSKSFRVVLYYGDVSGAVPFKWETCPGTPKHPQNRLITNNINPLTPPPSHYAATNSNNYSAGGGGSKILLHAHLLLRRILMNPSKKQQYYKSHSPISSPLSKSTSSNSWFSHHHSGNTPITADLHKPRRFLSWLL